MKSLITIKRSFLGLAATGVLATSILGAAPVSAAPSDNLAGPGDPTALCWTAADGSTKCRACVYYDGGHSCFVYTKKPAPAAAEGGGRAYMDYIASGLS